MSNPLGHGAVWLKRVKKHIYFEWNNFCCNTVMAINISIDKTFSVHDFQKLFMCNVFNEKIINTFDVLTFIQMEMDACRSSRVCTNKFSIGRLIGVHVSRIVK